MQCFWISPFFYKICQKCVPPKKPKSLWFTHGKRCTFYINVLFFSYKVWPWKSKCIAVYTFSLVGHFFVFSSLPTFWTLAWKISLVLLAQSALSEQAKMLIFHPNWAKAFGFPDHFSKFSNHMRSSFFGDKIHFSNKKSVSFLLK